MKKNKAASVPKKQWKLKDFRGLFYISPWLIGFLCLQLYPFLSSLYYSFTQYNVLGAPKFIGLNNYIRLFTIDPDFKKSILVTLEYALISVPAKLLFALLIAIVLNMKLKGINLCRTVYYIPSILGGSVAVSALWRLMFMSDGILNKLLALVGLPAVNWLGQAGTAMFTICLLQVWQFGSSMVLFLAALKQIPMDLHEAASIDGAGRGKRFFYITLPMITPIIFFNLIMQSINALQNFTSAFVITNGGPLKSTYLIGMKLYTEGFSNFKMGYASAISWVLFAIVLVFTMFIFKSSDAWVYYEDGGDF
ncbi:sugar ABC transporter permease [Clostridium sp. chh4-2]|uniref:carbohydrate ABC transporter permease n=1 Tax=Clostridium sp. chh4-2 TaxID=2067550 RepID=UPI000CCE787E|nr:sugar ABC transporter permease [Clostridium sp. chh4-2]PNV60224.1 sugar ABC transporter permease [Clostridium sp. chh4-2]